MLLLSALFVLPAAATAPTEAPVIALPATVTGLDPLLLTVAEAVADLRVDIVDRDGNTASWSDVAGTTDAEAVSIDLSAPTRGISPGNGPAQVTVLTGGAALISGTVSLDRDPRPAQLTARAQARRAELSWPAVAGPGVVTYAVGRQVASGAWVPIAELADISYVDRNLKPGRYRYRLTAQVPAAGRGVNTSAPTVASVRIEAPPPAGPPSEQVPEDPAADTPAATDRPRVAKPAIPTLPPRARPVAAAGRIGETVTPDRATRRTPKRTVKPVLRAEGPALGGLRSTPRLPGGVAPLVAPPATAATAPAAAPARRPLLPVAVPPAGTLVIDSAGAFIQPSALAAAAAGLLAMMVVAHLAVDRVHRRRRQLGGGRSPVST